MSPSEYAELVDFLGLKFDRIDARFERIDERFERGETEVHRLAVLEEENRDRLLLVAEAVQMQTERLTRFQDEVRGEFASVRVEMKVGFDAVHARVDRVEERLAETRAQLADRLLGPRPTHPDIPGSPGQR